MSRAWILGAGLALLAACVPMGSNVDALSAVQREQVGLPVLNLYWKVLVSDHGREAKPQEFASVAVGHGIGDDERLYLGSHDGVFYALHARTGRLLWKNELGSVSSRPVVDRGRIFVGTDDGFMTCLDTSGGEVLWRYATRGPILESPTLVGDVLFFSNEADQVYALEAQTGKFRWQYKGESPEEYTLRGHAGVVVDGDMVFTGFSNGNMVALRAGTGSVAWMASLRGEAERFVDMDSTPVVEGELVYATSSAGGVYALDKSTGLVRWRLPIENAGGLTIEGDRLYVAAAEQGIFAIDRNGNIVWRQGTRGGGEPARPVISGDYLVYTLSEDGVYVADKRTGVVHQFFQPGDGVSAAPTIDEDRMYVLSNGGYLYALGITHFE
ncbi:MAG TPA: PQQ-binding-like beta-propeller repeat protein [Kofleriaceae bacterium]|nr:PQQ-binding-like beta-propeller repeat protein [Kofleriaceae bacterium]